MSLSPCSLPRDIYKMTKYLLYNIFLFLIIDSIYVLPVSMFYMYLYCVVLLFPGDLIIFTNITSRYAVGGAVTVHPRAFSHCAALGGRTIGV